MSVQKLPAPPKWYAVYTKSRQEKKAAAELERLEISCFLPLHKVLRQWSDRKKWVEVPLFNSYLFVNITEKEYNVVLQVMGVVRFITFEGRAVAIPLPQIEAIKTYIEQDAPDYVGEAVPMEAGANVEVTRGAMTGLSGILLNIQGKHRVKVEIDCLGQSLIIDIPKSSLKIL